MTTQPMQNRIRNAISLTKNVMHAVTFFVGGSLLLSGSAYSQSLGAISSVTGATASLSTSVLALSGATDAGGASSGMRASQGAAASTAVQTLTNQSGKNDSKSQQSTEESSAGSKAKDAGTFSTAQEQLNEFQEFVLTNSGQHLPIFGQSLFSNPEAYKAPETVPVTADYTVGPGDEVVIRTWGMLETDFRVVVDKNGVIAIPRVGNVPVAGVKFQDLFGVIRSELSKQYRNFELSVTMGQLRGIQIFVLGNAAKPGSHNVSSVSSLVNALFASGGPSSTGSMRHIQLKRGNKIVTDFDLYDMLLDGDTSKDVRLRQGDVIFIPPVGNQIAIHGSVLRPAIYEIKEKTSLFSVLAMAGGMSAVAANNLASVERIVNRQSRRVGEFTLDKQGLTHEIMAGDVVRIYAVSPKIDNAVTLKGNVAAPYRFPWKSGMKITDLIPKKEALVTVDYWRRLNQQVDVTIGNLGALKSNTERMGEEINWDYAVLERMNPNDLTPQLIPFNLGKALEGDPANNLVLQAQDVVTVFSKSEISVSASKRTRYVRLEGEFNTAGMYQVKQGETLRQLIERVGGITPDAYLFGAEFSRESVRRLQQKTLNAYVDRMDTELRRLQAEKSVKVTANETNESLQAQESAQRAVISKLRAVEATGRLVLGLPANASRAQDLPDLVLEDGDRLYIPPTPSTIAVYGSVYNQNAYLYQPGKRLGDYLELAGGATTTADDSDIYLLRVDGTVYSKRQKSMFSSFSNASVMPGDAVVVPENMDRFSATKELKDWSQIFYQFALGVAGLKVLRE